MIKYATLDDMEDILELGIDSLLAGPYAGKVKFNREQSIALATKLITENGKVLLWEDSELGVCGILAFVVSPHFFTAELVAGEVMWYVKPEARSTGAALHLFWEAERQAKDMGAKKMQFTAPTEAVEVAYRRLGYSKQEVLYQKEF
jgi:GNAT superfamily N-acetyltransferase